MLNRLVIFGATGDLTSRKLMPALTELMEAGKLPVGFQILGVGRQEWDDERFRRHIMDKLSANHDHLSATTRENFLPSLHYRMGDVSKPEQVARLLDESWCPGVAYLALPPQLFLPTIRGLALTGMKQGGRVVVEKPFGQDLRSAQELNQLLHDSFPEHSVYRIDHFLHLQTVQNILGLRFANRIFQATWCRECVESVEIVWDETLTLEGRASYYDRAGALMDVVQNHLLQLLCLIAMEAPRALNEQDLRDRKVELLKDVRHLSDREIPRLTVRGRYGAGHIGTRSVPAYVNEDGIDPSRGTETFAQVTLWIDNDRWRGVPFVMRTGKALARDRREVLIRYRPVPHLPFESRPPAPNVIRLQLDPDRVALAVNINGPGNPFDLERVELDARFPPQDLPAYGRLLLDVLAGNNTLSIRADEAEESWRVIGPILESWKAGHVPLLEYPAGSTGPKSTKG